MFNLVKAATESLSPLVVPLMGYPGAQLTQSRLRDNLFESALHTRSILALHEAHQPDMVFPMMDLAVEAAALGLHVDFPDNESPTVTEHPVHKLEDLNRFKSIDVLANPRLVSFLETLTNLRHEIDTPVATYVTGPFTLAGLLMGATQIAEATIEQPELTLEVIALATHVITEYAAACVEAGAQLVAYLEPTAVMLSPRSFQTFSGAFVEQIDRQLDAPGVLHICGDTTHLIPHMCKTGVQGLSLDSVVKFGTAIQLMPEDVILIGNIDPVSVMAYGEESAVRTSVQNLLDEMQGIRNFLLSTGCDLPMDTPQANIAAFMETGRSNTSG